MHRSVHRHDASTHRIAPRSTTRTIRITRTIRTTTRRRLRVLAVPTAVLLAAGAGGSALAVPPPDAAHPAPPAAAARSAAHRPDDPRLTGSAKLRRVDGDDVRFSFDAHFRRDQTPGDARGTFGFRHVGKTDSGWAKGRVDCLVTGGKVATASGIVTGTDIPGLKGKRVGFSVHDVRGGPDRLGYSWAATPGPATTKDLPRCVSAAPFETVERGDFTVVPWDEPVR
ncbi:hypothetical protein [Streptomyces paromomycinus]|uniref:Repetin n=1 Tax=Streptomyces paromomycinus TaxID=92743 RepID=A0A401WD67_STREY|nr:hypothetical protein [Streptomyces paromomycinus]GCD47257.1 hypothetical protein GKJPGBOP_07023 [Streptomyces paromomycinus]